jgi:hypothetical protein
MQKDNLAVYSGYKLQLAMLVVQCIYFQWIFVRGKCCRGTELNVVFMQNVMQNHYNSCSFVLYVNHL